MRQGPYIIGVWQSSITDAAKFVDKHMLGRDVIQFVEDVQTKGSYWVMLSITDDQKNAILSTGSSQRPRWTVIP